MGAAAAAAAATAHAAALRAAAGEKADVRLEKRARVDDVSRQQNAQRGPILDVRRPVARRAATRHARIRIVFDERR